MSDYNNLTIIGRLTKEPSLKTVSNTNITSFSIASNRKYNGKEEVTFLDCTAFGKTADILNQYLKKGNQVLLSGRLKQERWDKDGQSFSKLVLIVENFQFIGGKSESQPKQETPPAPQTYSEEMPF